MNETPKRYTDKRRFEKSVKMQQEEAPIRRTSKPEIRIPVRLDHKTVIFIREKNLHKYRHLFFDEDHLNEHVTRFKAEGSKFFY